MKTQSDFQAVFARLRGILEKYSATFAVGEDKPGHNRLQAPVGPAALQAWGGKATSSIMPVARVQIGKAYGSYHLMGVCGNPKLLDGCSRELRARMQGKSCFNFKKPDEELFRELKALTGESRTSMRKAGYYS